MSELLKTLVAASERAANVARACRDEPELSVLLVTEKEAGEANQRFEHDFKTLADVLAQECVRNEVSLNFPELAEHVRGEETNMLGGVCICIGPTIENTAQTLAALVSPDAALRLAQAAHATPHPPLTKPLPTDLSALNVMDLGVWIDPIDATAEFIAGVRGEAPDCGEGWAARGLPCVTVLVGAFHRTTGQPALGVINQPFYSGGAGRIVWGACYGDVRAWSGQEEAVERSDRAVLLSTSEREETRNQLTAAGWEGRLAAGAGHKLLRVALGEAAACIVSGDSTFRWDTCAPHAILRARGGDVRSRANLLPLSYADDSNTQSDNNTIEAYCNVGGLVAYHDPKDFELLKVILE